MFKAKNDSAVRRAMVAVGASLLLAATSGCTREYSARPTYGFVVDAETRRPIEGAVVLAHWDLEFGLEGGSAYSWVVMETLTNAEGRFDFPAWGPRRVPDFLPGEARLKGHDPLVVFFKLGYQGIAQTQSQASKDYRRPKEFPTAGPAVREWYLNGETFHYRPAGNDEQRMAEELQSFSLELDHLPGSPCIFFDIPRSFRALEQAYAAIGATEAARNRFRYLRPAHLKWLGDHPQVQAMQRQNCGMTAREALDPLGK